MGQDLGDGTPEVFRRRDAVEPFEGRVDVQEAQLGVEDAHPCRGPVDQRRQGREVEGWPITVWITASLLAAASPSPA
ncbi:hypothetical protein [Streptomyces sp. NPDC056663]|uniref:hypothetical protein n=1 Tax=unclassified Streptomyces TaxID=2593676 RepID=UPI003629B2DC